jgi:hypothetical protein
MIKRIAILTGVLLLGCKSGPDHQSTAVDASSELDAEVDAPPALSPPPGAVAGGYAKNTFTSDFTILPAGSADVLVSANAIDASNTEASGFAWYTTCWYCGSVTPASAVSVVTDGATNALRMTGSSSLYGTLAGKQGLVGNSFSNGAYFEARVAFALPADGATSWPAFWALPNLAKNNVAWPGSTATVNYNNTNEPFNDSMEIDIMEFMPLEELGTTMGEASSTLHNWYGYQGYSCPNNGQFGSCQVASSVRAKDTPTLKYESPAAAPVFHTFGALWVPWDSTAPQTPGYVQFYVDDQPLGVPTTWVGLPPSQANPVGLLPGAPLVTWPSTLPPWTMGSTDLTPHALILDTGGNAFMDVQWVRVWQKQ